MSGSIADILHFSVSRSLCMSAGDDYRNWVKKQIFSKRSVLHIIKLLVFKLSGSKDPQ